MAVETHFYTWILKLSRAQEKTSPLQLTGMIFVNANLKIPPSRACSADSWITSDMHSHDSLPDKHKLSLTASGSPVLECPSSETEHNKVEEATCESDSLWLRESLFPQMKELRTVNTSKWARSFYP